MKYEYLLGLESYTDDAMMTEALGLKVMDKSWSILTKLGVGSETWSHKSKYRGKHKTDSVKQKN